MKASPEVQRRRLEAQAIAAGTRVAGISRDVAVVLTSPLGRCVRTAEVFAPLYLDADGLSTMDTRPDGNVAVWSVNETAHLR